MLRSHAVPFIPLPWGEGRREGCFGRPTVAAAACTPHPAFGQPSRPQGRGMNLKTDGACGAPHPTCTEEELIMFKSAIIGCGNIGPHHAKCYQSTQEIQLAAVVDVVEERAKKLGETYNVPWYTDVRRGPPPQGHRLHRHLRAQRPAPQDRHGGGAGRQARHLREADGRDAAAVRPDDPGVREVRHDLRRHRPAPLRRRHASAPRPPSTPAASAASRSSRATRRGTGRRSTTTAATGAARGNWMAAGA